MASHSILEIARSVLRTEIHSIQATADSLADDFVDVLNILLKTSQEGKKLIWSGVGKNKPIVQKLSATFNSTAIPSCFLDATQALHGDSGLCCAGDLAILLSNSGETDELLSLIPTFRRLGVTTVAFTSKPDSQLVALCDYKLQYKVLSEACPLQLAPTASTTAAMALGDALAMVALKMRGFTAKDFASFHPSGTLGKRLLLRVGDVMRCERGFCLVEEESSIKQTITKMTDKQCGSAAVIDSPSGKIMGIFTDGDFRRMALLHDNILNQKVGDHMTKIPITISRYALVVDALKVLSQHPINDLIVIDNDNKPVGLIDNQDLPKLRLG